MLPTRWLCQWTGAPFDGSKGLSLLFPNLLRCQQNPLAQSRGRASRFRLPAAHRARFFFLFVFWAQWTHIGECALLKPRSQPVLSVQCLSPYFPGLWLRTPPQSRTPVKGGFNERGCGAGPGGSEGWSGLWGGRKGQAHAGPDLGSSQAQAARTLILGER